MNNILKVYGIDKSFKDKKILNNINFEIKAGEIFGFLGPNGAGKSTTIRIITGLIKPDKGEIEILENSLLKKRTNALKHIGAIIENPVLYGELSAEENLRQSARMYENIAKSRIDEVLELIGLDKRKKDKVKTYSLGMKQRLGLGQAILHKPELLILDEPLNGLDPFGVLDFRKIIRDICNEYNSGILISSHALSEIEELCNKVAFIDKGEIISIENMDYIHSLTGDNVTIVTYDIDKCINVFKELKYIKDLKVCENKISLTVKEGYFDQFKKCIYSSGLDIEELYKDKSKLENRFINLIKGGI